MLIWGFRWKAFSFRQIAYSCSRCGRSTVHTAIVERGRLTIFFIPVIPIGSRYGIICNLCGLRLRAVGDLKEQLQGLERTGQLDTRTGPIADKTDVWGEDKINLTVPKSSGPPVQW
jgi:hypothetical protein